MIKSHEISKPFFNAVKSEKEKGSCTTFHLIRSNRRSHIDTRDSIILGKSKISCDEGERKNFFAGAVNGTRRLGHAKMGRSEKKRRFARRYTHQRVRDHTTRLGCGRDEKHR